LSVRKVGLNGYGEPIEALYLGGDQLADVETLQLIQDVKALEKTRLWTIYQEYLAHQAQEYMFIKGKTTDDLFFGKAILYSLSLLRELNKTILKIKK
jgi:hypothetical protein